MRNVFILIGVLLIISCGKKTSTPSGTTTSGSTKAVIKNGTTTVAHVVNFVAGGVVAVYLPSVDRYATIELKTGNYFNLAFPFGTEFYYPTDGCVGTPEVTSFNFVGEVGKTVVYEPKTSVYYLVATKRTSVYNHKSIASQSGECALEVDGTITPSDTGGELYFNITPTTRPYNFQAIAPLTITYE